MTKGIEFYSYFDPIHSLASVAWSPQGGYLAFGDMGGDVHVLAIPSCQIVKTYSWAKHGGCGQVFWSPDGRWIMSSYANGLVAVWNAVTGETNKLYHDYDYFPAIAWSPDSRYIAYGGGNEHGTYISIREAASGKHISTCTLPEKSFVSYLAWSSNGTALASGGYHSDVSLWDPFKGTMRSAFSLNIAKEISYVSTVIWSADDHLLAFGETDGNIYLWDTRRGNLLCQYKQQLVKNIKWTPDSRYLISAGENIHVWEPATANPIAIYRGPYAGDDAYLVTRIDWSANIKYFAAIGDYRPTKSTEGFLSIWKPEEPISKAQEEEFFALEEKKREIQRQHNKWQPNGKPTKLAEFVQEIRHLGLTPRETMNLLQVKNLNHLNYQEAFERVLQRLREKQQSEEDRLS